MEIEKTAEIIENLEPQAKVDDKIESEKDAELGTEQPKVEPKKDKPEEEPTKPQKTEENAEFARRRREEERQKALDKRELETVVRITGGTNPFTGEKIEDKTDMEEFYLMKEIESKGGDPIADFAKHQKQKRKENQTQRQQTEITEEQAQNDWQEFRTAHPDISWDELNADKVFLDYADGKIGRKPLAQIYDNYRSLFPKKAEPKKEEVKTVKQSPGSLSTEMPDDTTIMSKEQTERVLKNRAFMRKMSNSEFERLEKSAEYWAKHR